MTSHTCLHLLHSSLRLHFCFVDITSSRVRNIDKFGSLSLENLQFILIADEETKELHKHLSIFVCIDCVQKRITNSLKGNKTSSVRCFLRISIFLY